MALARQLNEAHLVFQIVGGDVDQFDVIRYRGTEGLSQLFRFEVELICADQDLDIDKIVGTAATLRVSTTFGERHFHGIISRFETFGNSPDQAYFRAELMPRFWLLTHRYQSRIFQQKSVPDIINGVFTHAGMASDQFRIDVKQTYEPREYCVQYRETDFNFVCRLLEEEGIWYYFEHTDKNHVLVLVDKPDAYRPLTGDAAVEFRAPTGMSISAEHIFSFRRSQVVRPGAVTLNDFNFENPTLKLEAKTDLARDKGLEFSDYPGEYNAQGRGTSLAKLRSEEFESGRVSAVGQTNSYRFEPGRTFSLTNHPAGALNAGYVITSATYQGKQATTMTSTVQAGRTNVLGGRIWQSLVAAQQDQNDHTRTLAEAVMQVSNRIARGDPLDRPLHASWLYHAGQTVTDLASAALAMGGNPLGALALPNLLGSNGHAGPDLDAPPYECKFECIPSTVSFRPPRVTPWPVMRGTQTARVVGPSGEEIHTDKYGRVMVQFHWDREHNFDEKSSCWIRVSQGMAGGQYGLMFLPRVGQEVVVDFLEGDPDKPLIVGRVYNADHMPAYELPGEKTKSYIKTHSSKGGGGTNEIRFEDLKDKEQILLYAQKDFHIFVKNQERHNVGEIQHLTVEKEQRIKVGGHRSVDVGGKDALHVKDTRNVVVDADVIEDFKAKHSHKVAGQYLTKAEEIVFEANSGISFKVGGNFVLIDSSGVSIVGSAVNINSGGSALSGSPGSPASPAAPEKADEAKPGKDKSYTGEPSEPPKIEPKPYEGHWISISLKDKTGKPMAGEYYEIKTPSGKILKGTLDVNGFARRWVDEPGNCDINFPLLNADEWSRA